MTTKRKTKLRKHAKNTLPGASPISGTPPPEETKWKPGQPSPNPHGRPRKFHDLQELIKDTLAEEIRIPEGVLTRAQAMIRTMLIKSPTDRIALLEYAFGKVPQAFAHMTWKEYLEQQGLDAAAVFNGLVAAAAAAEHDAARISGADADRSASGGAGEEQSGGIQSQSEAPDAASKAD
jgi:hypothetical protein